MAISKLSINASLKDVMDKFEEISLNDFLGIKIIVANSLPSEVKEEQIVIITDETVNEVILNPTKPTLTTGQAYIQTDFDSADFAKYEKFNPFKNNLLSLYVSDVLVKTNNGEIKTEGYIGKNGKWVQFSASSFIVWNPYYDNYGLESMDGWVIRNRDAYGPNMSVTRSGDQLIVNNSGYFLGCVFSKQSIDFTKAKTLEIDIPKVTAKAAPSADYGLSFYVYIADGNTSYNVTKTTVYKFVGTNKTTLVEPGTIKFNVSNITGLKYIAFALEGNGSTNGTMYIDRIELIK